MKLVIKDIFSESHEINNIELFVENLIKPQRNPHKANYASKISYILEQILFQLIISSLKVVATCKYADILDKIIVQYCTYYKWSAPISAQFFFYLLGKFLTDEI